MNKASELRKLSVNDLQNKLNELQREQFDAKMLLKSSQGLKNNQLIKVLKRQVARAKTILTQMK